MLNQKSIAELRDGVAALLLKVGVQPTYILFDDLQKLDDAAWALVDHDNGPEPSECDR